MVGCGDFRFLVVFFIIFPVVIFVLTVVIFWWSPKVVVAGNGVWRWLEVAGGGIRKKMVRKYLNIKINV